MNIHWDSGVYARDFDFVPKYGEALFGLIDQPAGARAVDLGCGAGALTVKLAERGYEVLGLDGSADMLAEARRLHPALALRQADARSFRLEEPADLIFSNAVIHWIDRAEQPALARNIAANLRPGGTLVCEFGGYGCAETVHGALEHAFARHGLSYPRSFFFPTIGEYAPLLEQAGLRVDYAALFDRPTPQKTPDGLTDWIHMFVRAPFAGLDAALEAELIAEAVEEARPALHTADGWVVDYVRIRLRAHKL